MLMIQIVYLFYLALSQEDGTPKQYLTLGDSVQGFVSPRTQNHQVYLFNVPEIKNQTDLVLQLKTLNPNSDPNLYISKKVKEPLSVEDADVQACEAQGMDICVISNEKIQENDVLYISVVSRFPSRYILRIELDQEQMLKVDSFLTFKLTNEKQSQIIDFMLSEFNTEQTEIEINVQVVNQEYLEEPFQVFMNKWENGVPTNSMYDYKATDTWGNQKVIEFNQQKPFEQYKILIQGEQGAVFRVMASKSQKLKFFNFYETIVQVVEQGEFDFYQVEPQLNCDIGVRLTPFKGYAKLYVHYNKQPPLLESYEWQEKNKDGEVILITQEELKNKNITLKNLYLAVMGEELCTYELQLTCIYERTILPGINHQKFVSESQVTIVNILDYRNEGHYIQLNLHTFEGIINFLTTNCADESICPYTEELFLNQDKYELMTQYTMLFTNRRKEAQFILNCDGMCAFFVVAVLDKSSTSPGKFTIQYKIIEKTMSLLQNTPHKSQVEKDNYQYYKFFVSENEQMQRLHFLVTPIQGDVTMYVSTTYQQPNEWNHEYKSQNNSINFGGRFANQPQPGTYYLSIYGQSFSKFIITVWAIKNFQDFQQFGKFPWHYIQLYQGDQQQHSLVDEDFVLYKIDMKGYDMNRRDSLNVILQKEYGQFRMFGFNRPETNESIAIWQSGQIISIPFDDKNYPEILYLKIRLDHTGGNYGSFRIAYYYYKYMIEIFQDEPFFNFLSAGYSQGFGYLQANTEAFVITKRTYEFDQSSLDISIQPLHGLDIRYSKNNSTIIVQQNKDHYCQILSATCSEYFYFSLTSKFDAFYTILISKIDKSKIQLVEDQPITKALPIGEDYFYFYSLGQEANILAFTYYGEIKLYAKVVATLDSPEPTESLHDKVSQKHKSYSQVSIYFSQNDLNKLDCNGKCIIKITVIVNRDGDQDFNINVLDYTIQYNSKLIMLRESEIQSGELVQNEYKYYKIHVPRNDTNLMIMLKPDIFCDADLLVSKSKFPDLGNYDWGSFDLQSDVLVIEPGNTVNPDLTGDYYVGVHGYEKCQYGIQYHLQNVEIYEIFLNQPFKFFVNSEFTIFLKLQTYGLETPFTIFVQSHSETAYFYVHETDLESAKFSSFSQNPAQFKYNNFGMGYQKSFMTEPLQPNNILIIALKTYTSEIVRVQVNNNDTEIFLESQSLFQYFLEKGKEVTIILNPKSMSTSIQIYMYSGSLVCSYYFEKFYEVQNFTTLILLDIRPDNYKNIFNISNQENSYLKLNFEAISSAYFSILYFTDVEEMNKIYSIYPVFFSLKAQSEKEMYYMNYEFSPLLDQGKTFSISVQIQDLHDYLQKSPKHRSIPLIKVYSNSSQLQILPIKQTILSNLIQNEYFQIDNVYRIVLQSQSQQEQNYQVQVGTSDLRPLVPRIKQLRQNELYQSSYWAVQQNFMYLFYEMQFCNGIFSVFTGKDYEQLKQGQYDQRIDIRQNKQVFGFFDQIQNLDITYLKFDLIKTLNSQITNAQYTIRVYYVDEKEEIPYNDFYPGLQGYLTPQLLQNPDDTVTLYIEFAPIQITNQDLKDPYFELKQIEYFVILQEKSEGDDLSLDFCSDPSNYNSIVRNQTTNETTLFASVTLHDVKFPQQRRTLVFTILATVDVQLYKDEQLIQLDYYYETNSIRWNPKQQVIQETVSINYQWVGVSIVIIILIIALIVFVKKRKAQNMQKLMLQISEKYENKVISNYSTEGIELHYRGLNE
ncbi:unnamed protein product (macronuclear) [Paramecium tetraurelia]|uniref:Transmembrane protein n=1 Tax=Paramecium tetraurelia TaxID=5888 RepID=A0DZI6_PARTE|nr:uncharacterized protein GSPATT00021620001 [Paramecium tetraurelia]CAK88453.1 unnamed protein product [Paramecium tetraurelia]|eukprot:XP_001455850.1 hypothetical protein (macronuclear) [Paramecium tetraurelia strain d4-2]